MPSMRPVKDRPTKRPARRKRQGFQIRVWPIVVVALLGAAWFYGPGLQDSAAPSLPDLRDGLPTQLKNPMDLLTQPELKAAAQEAPAAQEMALLDTAPEPDVAQEGAEETVAGMGTTASASADPGSSIPVPTVRTDGYRSEVEAAWFSGGSDLNRRAQNARVRALQLGAPNYEAAARATLAAPGSGDELERAKLAVRLAPDLPLAHMRLARAHLTERAFFDAASEVIAGIRAIPRNVEATLWLAASLIAMFAAVLTIGSVAFIVWVGVGVFRHASHDLADLVSKEMPDFARAALLAAVLLVPVLLGEGLMGLVLALFLLGFLYTDGGYRRALALSAVLLLVGLYPMTRLAGSALTALDSDPVATAAHLVMRSMASPSDIEQLQAASDTDWLAGSALAVHERRLGNRDSAQARYERLLEDAPSDPVVLGNLTNIHFERGEYPRAVELGERAAGMIRSATLLFNLSQVYARSFRMDEFEGAMAQAQLVDPAVVAELSETGAPDFVADLAFPLGPIRDRMLLAASGDRFVEPVSRLLMPGRLGQTWMVPAAAFVLAALLGVVAGGRWEHSSCCTRCGRRVCNRCDGNVWNSEICDGCHHLFNRPETTDPVLRTARLSELRHREARVGRISVIASLLLPGVGGLLARRPQLSFLGLLLFACGSILFLWRDGIVVDPLAVGGVGPLVFGVGAGFAFLGYLGVVSLSLLARRNL